MANEVTIQVTAKPDVDKGFATVRAKAARLGNDMRGGFLKSGGNSGAAFMAGFIKTITFGQVGGGFAQAAVKMAPQAAKLGAGLGVAMAGALVIQLTNALTAGLPLALGAGVLALPISHLVKTETKAIDQLKEKWQGFKEFISEPLRIPFQESIEAIGDGLERIRKPFRALVSALGPALEPLTKGVMRGLENFIRGIEPAMPAVAAGMEAWARAAPKIGTHFGRLISRIMDNPEATVQAVEDLSDAMMQLGDAAASIVSGLQRAAGAYGRFARTVDKQEGSIDKAMHGFNGAVKRGVSGAVAALRGLASRGGAALSSFASRARSRFNQVVAAGRSLASGIRSAASRVVSAVQGMMSRFVAAVRSGASRAIALFNSLRARIRGVFAGAGGWLVGAGAALIRGLIAGIRSAAGAAASAAASVVRNAINAARSLIPGRATGGYVGSSAAGGGPRGGQVLVGEQGPELVDLPFGSKVHSNPDSRRMMANSRGGGGDTHFHFHGPVYGDHNALRRALVDMKRRGELDVVTR